MKSKPFGALVVTGRRREQTAAELLLSRKRHTLRDDLPHVERCIVHRGETA